MKILEYENDVCYNLDMYLSQKEIRGNKMLLFQIIIISTSLLMVGAPSVCTRKEDRGNKDAEKRIRTMGGWLLVAGFIWLVTDMIF